MSAPRRYHGPSRWEKRRGQDIRAAVRTLTQILDEESHHPEWRDADWHSLQRRWAPGSTPRWPDPAPPRRTFQRTPGPRHWRPYYWDDRRWGRNWKHKSPRPSPWVWRPRVQPRRGPPVAAIVAPRWYQQDLRKRRPSGNVPGGPLRGGPERPAGDQQTPLKKSTRKTSEEKGGKGKTKRARSTTITVDKGGNERVWEPLSRSATWRAGRF
mgnify:CR=1 FL=1